MPVSTECAAALLSFRYPSIMANGRQKCYAFPEQQENKILKQKIFPGNSSKIQVAVRKKK